TQPLELEEMEEPSVMEIKEAQVDAQDFKTRDVLSAGSKLKMAELTANEIYDIRENRTLLVKGQAPALLHASYGVVRKRFRNDARLLPAHGHMCRRTSRDALHNADRHIVLVRTDKLQRTDDRHILRCLHKARRIIHRGRV
ncbi:MAG: DUF4831 family protein, partial [Alistipes sp.]|nr:DUF4831 family protein [Alistipes sp.]